MIRYPDVGLKASGYFYFMKRGVTSGKLNGIGVAQLPVIVIFAASIVFYFLMTLFTSPHLDDLQYGVPYRKWLLGEASFPGLDPWWTTIKSHFYGINGRFGDKLLLGFILLPKWIQAFIASFSTVGFYIFASRLATTKILDYPYLSAALTIALIICLPWFDSLFLACMIVNYILASFFGLAALLIYFRPPQPPETSKILKYTGCVILGFLAGSWHEGFVFVVAPGMVIYLFVIKKLTSVQLCILIGGVAGAIFILCNPGFWVRYDNQMHFMTMKEAGMIFSYANISLGILILVPLFLSVKSLRRKYSKSDVGILITAFIALLLSLVIYSSNLGLPRALWFGIILGIVAIGVLLRPFKPSSRIFTVLKGAVWVGIIFVMTHFVVAGIEQYNVDKEFKEVIGLYRKSDDGTVFYSRKASGHRPWLALGLPYYDQFEGWKIDAGIHTFYKKKEIRLSIVPEELKDFSISHAQPVNTSEGIYQYKGYYLSDSRINGNRRWKLVEVTTSDGHKTRLNVLSHRFKDSEGRLMNYLDLSQEKMGAEIKSISVIR